MTNKTIIAGLVALAFVAGTMMTGTMADAAKGEPNGQPFKQLQEQVDELDTEMVQLQGIVSDVEESTTRADSFFDVFFDVEAYSVDSFFDIFTELQADVDRIDGHVTVLKSQTDSFFDVFFDIDVSTGERNTPDSFFDIFVDAGEERIDSFFDIFTELNATDEDLQAQIDALEERLAALENPEPEPTCAECSNNFSFGNRDCLDQFRNGEVNDPDALQECFAANLIIYEECLASLSDEEYSMCVDE